MGKKKQVLLDEDDLEGMAETGELLELLEERGLSVKNLRKTLQYSEDLLQLQTELMSLQRSVIDEGRRVVVLFEGRDAAGKGGTIRRFMKHLIPRAARVVALPKPSDVEQGQWYFQRYVAQLPTAGEIRFFDRSWYNRAVVEPVMGFCTQEQYEHFMDQVLGFEQMIQSGGVELIKLWLEISREEQAERFAARRESPLTRWKIGPVDAKAQGLWDQFTRYKDAMLQRTHSDASPWVILEGDSKKKARLAAMRTVLSTLDYRGKGDTGVRLDPDPDLVSRPA